MLTRSIWIRGLLISKNEFCSGSRHHDFLRWYFSRTEWRVIPGHLLWRAGFLKVTKGPYFGRWVEWLLGCFRVWAGFLGTGLSRGFRISLRMNGWRVWVGKEEKRRWATSWREGPGGRPCARWCPGFGLEQVTRRVEVFSLLEKKWLVEWKWSPLSKSDS